ncbi:MAG: hypothetical protein NT022_00680 [Deltaproteobacteria bacterium]|nr:hypothetical protein [Deltaproteobacteria bacterium]
MKGLKHIITKELYGKARASIFVLTIILMVIAIIFFLRTQAGEIYTHTDTNGINVVSNIPISEKNERRAQKIESSRTMTETERKVLENDNNAKQIHYKKEREGMGNILLLYSIFR